MSTPDRSQSRGREAFVSPSLVPPFPLPNTGSAHSTLPDEAGSAIFVRLQLREKPDQTAQTIFPARGAERLSLLQSQRCVSHLMPSSLTPLIIAVGQTFSTGRGGAGNIRSPSRDINNPLSPDPAQGERELIREHVAASQEAPVGVPLPPH